ncbi:MAG: insulinase family protein [Dysgonamonadaceae bacterium]|jgi:predicted Zn-dependent peptidase|nr:insulinase family protein [Dysgonamonadaceae bacterium]
MKTIYSLFAFLFVVSTLNAQTLNRSIRPASAPAKEIHIKDAQLFTLPNGLKVFLVEDKTTPILYYSLTLDVDPALQGNKAGIYDVFNDVFGKATTSRTKEQLNKEVDLIAAQFSASRSGVSISFLKKYEQKALDLFSDILLHPVFTQEDFNLTIEKTNTLLAGLGDDGGEMTDRVSSVLTYGKQFPYGELTTKQTIGNVQIADLENYYNTYFAPNTAYLVIVGDISLTEAKASAQKHLGQWKKKTVPVAKYLIPSAPATTEVAYIVKSEAVQSSITVTYPLAFQIGQPDYDAARIMNYILGGSATGYLFTNLREQHSYTYGAYSNLSSGEHIGRFEISGGRGPASVKAAITDSAVYEIFHELNRIITEPVTEESLKAAKTYLAGNFSRSLENSSTLAGFAINIDKYKLPKDYYKNYLKRIEAVTVADVQAAAKKYVKPNNAWIVVTGDKVYADKLLPFASDKSIHYFDHDANSVAAPTGESTDIPAETIIANYVNALGGKAAIDKIHDYTITADVKAMGQSLSFTQRFKTPDKTLVNLEMNGMAIQKMAFDGTALRISGMGGAQELTEGDLLNNIKDGAGVVPEADYVKNGYALSVGDIEEVNGQKAYVLTATKGESKAINYFDVTTGLKLKSINSLTPPEGEPQTTAIEYSDYRAVNGVQFPFLLKQSMGGMSMDCIVKSVEINQGIDDSVFQ